MKAIIHRAKTLRMILLGCLLTGFANGAWAEEVTYKLYTGDITEGDYLLVYNGKAMKAAVSSNRLSYLEVTPSNDEIQNPDASIIWKVANIRDSYYSLYNASVAKYAASTGTKNQAKLESSITDNSYWTISGTTTYDFTNKANSANNINATLRNNGTYGFACYAIGTGGALSLYKLVANSDPSKQDVTLSFPESSYSVNIGESFTAPTLSNESGVEVTYSSSNTSVATVNSSSGAITTNATAGTTTITASFAGDNTYNSASASYTLTVVDPNAPGTMNNPYTVAQARDAIDAGTGITDVYATGIVSEIVTAYNSQYGNITYNISSDGTTTADQLQAFRGKGIDGANFNSADDVQVGDVVVIYGTLKKHTDGTYEFGEANQLVSLNRPEVAVEKPTFDTEGGIYYGTKTITIACSTNGATIKYSYDNNTWTDYTGMLTISETTTVYAKAVKDNDESAVVSVTYIIKDPNGPGTENHPYTVAQAIEFINILGSIASDEVYVNGVISQIDGYNNNTITYWISDDGTTTTQLEVYKGKGLNGADFSAETDLALGDEVIVYGKVKLYNTTYEFDTGNYLYSLITKSEAGLSYQTTSFEVTLGDSFTAPTLTNPNNLTVTYTSSNASVATVNESTGEVTLGSIAGSATITASFAGNNDYKAGSASYTINIVDPSGTKTYYALVAQFGNVFYAVNGSSFSSGKYGAVEVDAVNGKVISEASDAISWEFTTYTNVEYIKNKATDSYIGYGTSGTNLTKTTTSYSWTIDKTNSSWLDAKDGTRSIVYRNSELGFKAYAVSNINKTSGYANTYTQAYTFAEGYVRTVTAGNWGTICLTNSVAADDYSGVKFYSIVGKNKAENPTSITLQEVEGNLQAGKAYLFQANDGATKLIAAYGSESITAPIDASSNNGLIGSFTGTEVAEGMYLLSGGQIVKCGTGCSIAANRAYIDMSAVPVVDASIKGVHIYFEGVDGIDGIFSNQPSDAVIYDLSGRRVNKATKGLYFINGKKVAVK